MAKTMFVLRPDKNVHKVVCPTCAARGRVLDSCPDCHGTAVKEVLQYYIQNKPIKINFIDRDPATGVLRYWENDKEFYYETINSSLNKFIPDVPYGIHLCHYTKESAKCERDRVNMYLANNVINITDICTEGY